MAIAMRPPWNESPYFQDAGGGRLRLRMGDIATALRRPDRAAVATFGALTEHPALRRYLEVWSAVEQVPDADNRIELLPELDEVGMPRVRVSWGVGPAEEQSYRRGLQILLGELEKVEPGISKAPLDEPDPWPSEIVGNWHHAGTTRMHADPNEGRCRRQLPGPWDRQSLRRRQLDLPGVRIVVADGHDSPARAPACRSPPDRTGQPVARVRRRPAGRRRNGCALTALPNDRAPVTRHRIPEDVLSAAHARARAREARDWTEADRLRATIEAAGWKVADRGTDFALSPAAPPDVAEDERVRYGSSRNVPSRLDEEPVGVATVVLIATDWEDDLGRALAGLRAGSPAGASVVIVADAPSAAQEAALVELQAAPPADLPVEVVWTSERLGHAAALNVGLRRASGPIAIVLDSSVEPTGDIVTPLSRALDDPTVAVAGGWGIVSKDLRHFEDAPAGDVDAIEGYCQAFRRADYAARGPLDERFTFYRNLDIWWSLVLRDSGPDHPARRALQLDGLPIVRHEHRGYTSLSEPERDRLSKRNFYRIIDRFGARRDLLVRPG